MLCTTASNTSNDRAYAFKGDIVEGRIAAAQPLL